MRVTCTAQGYYYSDDDDEDTIPGCDSLARSLPGYACRVGAPPLVGGLIKSAFPDSRVGL